jgi:hypothetical protein
VDPEIFGGTAPEILISLPIFTARLWSPVESEAM